MRTALRDANQRKIETIFNLVEQFKECYLDQKADGHRFEIRDDEEEEDQEDDHSLLSRPVHTLTLTEFRPQEKMVNVIINTCRDSDNLPNASTKEQSCGKGEEVGFS